MSQVLESLTLDDDVWEQVVRATNGAASLCYQCGVCTATCPWGEVRQEPLSVRKLIRRAQLGVGGWGDELWLCTTCGACEVRCPRGVNIAQVMLALRDLAWKERRTPHGLSHLMWDVYFDGNPWGRPPSQRSAWGKGLDVPAFSPDQETLYYVGCTASYDRRSQKVARSMVSVLRAAGVNFGTLGDSEPCCGHAVRDLGHHDYVNEIIETNASLFEKAGAATVVTTSPHCYDMFKNHYPDFSGQFRPLHYTHYLAQLIEDGRLKFAGQLPVKITFHDPCYLGRRNEVYKEPRQVLQSIPGVELVEMERSFADALCCGGGGGRMWMETAPGERFSDLRVEEAAATGAQIMATACPHCLACLEDSTKVRGLTNLRVLDIVEIVQLALQPQPSTTLAAVGRS